MSKYFDLIIVGGGAAGFAAAIKADELGAKTLMVNSGLPMGGTCVNVGCVPTKFLMEVASEYYEANHSRFNSLHSSARIDFGQLMKEKDELVNSLRKTNYQDVLNNLPNVTYKQGQTHFISDREIEVNGGRFTAKRFILATGCRTKVPPIEGLEEVGFLTHRTIMELKELPESLVVIGAGPIGLEFAQIFSRLGSDVTVVELMKHILPQSEQVVSDELRRCLEEEGIKIITGAKIKRAFKDKKKILQVDKDGNLRNIESEEILLAAGVIGNTEDLGLENTGIDVDKNGFIKVDEYLRTPREHIYAAGDITGPPLLESVAAKEGNISAQNALKDTGIKMDFENAPYAVFTSPQVASVGMKESEYMSKFGTCLCRVVRMDKIPKPRLINRSRGLIQMVLHHENKKIMGVHILSELASEIIHEATFAIKSGLTIDDIISTVHVFPTFSEAIKVACQSFRHDLKRMSCCVE